MYLYKFINTLKMLTINILYVQIKRVGVKLKFLKFQKLNL